MNSIVRRMILILTVLAPVLSSSAYAQDKSTAGNEAITQLYNAAKKEGTVIIWGPTDAIIYQRMQAYLDKQYPGIKIQHFESIPEPLVQRIIAESQAGKPAAVDIIQSGSLRALRPLIDRDMLATFPGWEKDFGLDALAGAMRFMRTSDLSARTISRCRLLTIRSRSVRRRRRKVGKISPNLNGKAEKSSSKPVWCRLRCSVRNGAKQKSLTW